MQQGTFCAHVVKRKGAEEYSLKRVLTNLWTLGYKRVAFRCDQEASLLELKRSVQEFWTGEVVPEESPVGESQSNGSVESGVRSVEGHTRVLHCALERNYNIAIGLAISRASAVLDTGT